MKQQAWIRDLAWDMRIEHADNGFIVTTKTELSGMDERPRFRASKELVFLSDHGEHDTDGMERLFYTIAEHFGQYNLTIKVMDRREEEDGAE